MPTFLSPNFLAGKAKDGVVEMAKIQCVCSFGDNELSPECLDGAQKFLKPDGISIPYEYTSFLGPLQVIISQTKVSHCVLFFPELEAVQ